MYYDNKHQALRRWLPTWLALRKLGSNPIIRTSYFWFIAVPIAAKATAHFPVSLRMPLFDHGVVVTLGLPFSWQMFFWASCAFSIATFIYQLRCPGIIKDYASFREFQHAGEGGRSIQSAFNDFVRGRKHIRVSDIACNTTQEAMTHFVTACAKSKEDALGYVNDQMINYPEHVTERFTVNTLDDCFTYVRHVARWQHEGARLFCTLLYALGGVFVFVVACQSVYAVWKLTFETAMGG